jgi:hypothetical protein
MYCGKSCRDEARYLRELEQAATYWHERGYADREAHVQRVIRRRLAERRGMAEALAADLSGADLEPTPD